MNEFSPQDIASLLDEVRRRPPLVHNITNYVVMNYTANALLALGASPVMAHAIEEVEEMAGLADALVLNLGTLSTPWIESMLAAARSASRRGRPVVLDPVGAGATRLRTDTAHRLLETRSITVVRANASEVRALAGQSAHVRGVDAADPVESARDAALKLAGQYQVVVAMTGPEDYITDGRRAIGVANGHPLMARVSGTGCVASALTGAFCARSPDACTAAAGSLVVLGLAGELAAQANPRPGAYAVRLLDSLDEINADIVKTRARLVRYALHPDRDEHPNPPA
jgi:hydroxyethylthiazole kinase